MSILTKTAFGLVLAATAFSGLTATPAAAHDRQPSGYSGYYDNSYYGHEQRYDRDGYRDNDRRGDEWRRHHRHHASRHHDRFENNWRDHDRRDEWRRGY